MYDVRVRGMNVDFAVSFVLFNWGKRWNLEKTDLFELNLFYANSKSWTTGGCYQ
jgi:hypothetical protein